MAIDGRRRLVLVRRDNVEHLILLGGPSDVVVEQAIQRQRQRPAARPQAVGTAAEMPPPAAEPSVSPPENPPIPFPQARTHQSPVHQPAPAPMAERTFAPARRAAQPQPTRYEATSAAAPAAPLFQPIAEPLPSTPEPTRFETSVYEPRTIYAPNAATNGHQAHKDYGNGASQPAATSPFIMPAQADSETAAKVNDLEREMARLLGEITANRPS
jgi:hypothetical protein